MKKRLAVALAATMLVSSALYAQNINVMINGKTIKDAVSPVQKNNTTLVPLRVISENLGAEVKWNGQAKTVTITQGDKVIVLKIGQKTATVNGEKKTLDLAPERTADGVTMVPVRFVSENLNTTVKWDKASKTVIITSKTTGAALEVTTTTSAAVEVAE